ncbi:hypothetical protein, partial [Dyella japonica]|uniref:hypothetical protein n=1 Tax=Dyella japonica TaxID=231455 RepID=UPI001B8057A1
YPTRSALSAPTTMPAAMKRRRISVTIRRIRGLYPIAVERHRRLFGRPSELGRRSFFPVPPAGKKEGRNGSSPSCLPKIVVIPVERVINPDSS